MTSQPGIRELHKQVLVHMPIYVDEGIIFLLHNLWKMGYYTEWSCQGDDTVNGEGYVSFRHWGNYRGVTHLFSELNLPYEILRAENGAIPLPEFDEAIGVIDVKRFCSVLYFKPEVLPKLIELTEST